MIILSYGMTKSGSTLAFELCKSILEQKGFVQRRLPDDVVVEGHHINFLSDISLRTLQGLLREVSADEKIAVKIHAPIGNEELAFVEEQVSKGNMKLHVNYRDPREVCLSLVDAGAHAREKNRKAFSEIETLADAAKAARRQLNFCRRWGSTNGAYFLYYRDVAFDTRRVVDDLCADFGFERFDDAEYEQVTNRVFNEAFTQKNRAVMDRYKDDLTVRQNEFLLEEIKGAAPFIRRVCEQKDYSWFKIGRDAEAEVAD